jgi:threonine aldolase
MRIIDLRSDTVTRPSDAMRRAMASAEVGDDVYGEDPTVRRLEERTAELLGKERALFVPSGVMGNQLAIKVHTKPGDEVLVERSCHILNYESGAPGLLSGVQLNVLDGVRGRLAPEQISNAVRPEYYWEPRTRLLCLENSINRTGGNTYSAELLRDVSDAARDAGLKVHLDGARLWNASAHTGSAESDFAKSADTVMVCLSKGLGAPVGSILAGSRADIGEAHRYRKLFGGGMRQVGIIAAAGLYAIDNNRQRLTEDHRNATLLAEGISALPGFEVNPDHVETNIVMFDVRTASVANTVERLRELGVMMHPFGPRTIRATTHLDVSREDVVRAVDIMQSLFGQSAEA